MWQLEHEINGMKERKRMKGPNTMVGLVMHKTSHTLIAWNQSS